MDSSISMYSEQDFREEDGSHDEAEEELEDRAAEKADDAAPSYLERLFHVPPGEDELGQRRAEEDADNEADDIEGDHARDAADDRSGRAPPRRAVALGPVDAPEVVEEERKRRGEAEHDERR